jgi:hypothetical protein
MKRILNLPTLVLLTITAMFLYSCESDPTEPPVNVPPVVTITSATDITVNPEEVFTIDFTASIGSESPLKAVTVYEDGIKVPTSRLSVNGSAAAANPLLITGSDVDGLSWTFDIVAQSSAATTVVYEVEVQDDAGGRQSGFVNVTTAGTPPTLTTTSPMTVETFQDIKNVFKLTAVKGTGDLVSITVTENDQLLEVENIFWKGISMSVATNPFLLDETDQGGFDAQDLYIMTPASEGTFVYKIILTDEYDLSAELEFDVTTLPNGTAIEMREGVLLNAAGPMGTGGLDLDTGMGTGSLDAAAEIKDNGIDQTLPINSNWRRTISPTNNAVVKYLKPGQGGLPETFAFADVAFKEDLPGFFDSGVALTNGASEVVEIEDVFIVERDGKYWMLEVIEIVTDPSGNEDSYKFDIKY